MSFHQRAGAERPSVLGAVWKVLGSTITAISIVNLIQHYHKTALAQMMREILGFYRVIIHPVVGFCAEAINAGLAQLPFALSLPAWYQEWLALSAIGAALLLRAGQDPHVLRAARRRPRLYAQAILSFAVIGLFYSVTLLGLLGLVIALRGMTYSPSDKRVKDRTMVAAGDSGWATVFAVAAFYVVNYALQMRV